MRPNLKRLRWRDEAVEIFKWHLEVEWIFAPQNLAIDELLLALHYLAVDSAKAKSKIGNLKSKMKSGA
jgi:hypothetical protein